MSDKSNPRQGHKLEASVVERMDPKRIAVTQDKEQESEVAGQYRYNGWTSCPWCGNVGWTNGLSSDYYITVRCGRCGSYFSA